MSIQRPDDENRGRRGAAQAGHAGSEKPAPGQRKTQGGPGVRRPFAASGKAEGRPAEELRGVDIGDELDLWV